MHQLIFWPSGASLEFCKLHPALLSSFSKVMVELLPRVAFSEEEDVRSYPRNECRGVGHHVPCSFHIRDMRSIPNSHTFFIFHFSFCKRTGVLHSSCARSGTSGSDQIFIFQGDLGSSRFTHTVPSTG